MACDLCLAVMTSLVSRPPSTSDRPSIRPESIWWQWQSNNRNDAFRALSVIANALVMILAKDHSINTIPYQFVAMTEHARMKWFRQVKKRRFAHHQAGKQHRQHRNWSQSSVACPYKIPQTPNDHTASLPPLSANTFHILMVLSQELDASTGRVGQNDRPEIGP